MGDDGLSGNGIEVDLLDGPVAGGPAGSSQSGASQSRGDPDEAGRGQAIDWFASDVTSEPAPGQPPARMSRAWWASQVRLPRPPLAVLVGVGGLAVMAGMSLGVVVVAIVAVTLADTLLVPAPWRLPVARVLPSIVSLGAVDSVTWSLRGNRPWPQRVALVDELPESLGVQRRVAVTASNDRVTTVTLPMIPTRRGSFLPTELAVRVAGPLRLVQRQHVRLLPDRIDVHPAFPSRREAELRVTDRRVLEVGMRAARSIGRGTDFEALRDYTFDDEVRRLDWSATARAGKPIVRTYRAERNQTVRLILDTGRLSAGLVGGITRLEHLMDAALAVTTVATGVGDKVGFTAFATAVRAEIAPSGDSHQRGRIATAMTPLQPMLVEPDYERAFTEVVTRQRRRALLVLLTDLSSEALVDTLVPALPVLLRSHMVIVGAVNDPRVRHWLQQPGETVDDAFLAAGAATLQRSRRRTAALLRQRGVVVVDEVPARLASKLMDAYLDVKASGRL